MKFSLIIDAWVKGCFFNAYDNQGNATSLDKDFMEKYARNPILVLSDHCKFDCEKYKMLYLDLRKIMEGMR